jgi:hypothetical protein
MCNTRVPLFFVAQPFSHAVATTFCKKQAFGGRLKVFTQLVMLGCSPHASALYPALRAFLTSSTPATCISLADLAAHSPAQPPVQTARYQVLVGSLGQRHNSCANSAVRSPCYCGNRHSQASSRLGVEPAPTRSFATAALVSRAVTTTTPPSIATLRRALLTRRITSWRPVHCRSTPRTSYPSATNVVSLPHPAAGTA